MKVTLFRQKVTFLLHKSYTLLTEVVNGSNESLYFPDEELGLDMSFWRKIVNDYREGFHGVISQPKSPKIANFGKPSENCLQLILNQNFFWI